MTSPNFEFEEPEPVEASHLLKTQCQECGTPSLAAPGQTSNAFCGPCRGGSVVGYVGEHTVPVGYPREIRGWVENAERIVHPLPEISGYLADHAPDPVMALVKFAGSQGWRTYVVHARGNGVHGSTGRPTAVRDSYAVHMERPGRKAVAVYAGGSWGSMWLLPDLFGCPTLADLKVWLETRGEVGQNWRDAIRARVEAARVAKAEVDALRAEAVLVLKTSGLSVQDICTQFGLELEIEEVRKILAPAKSKKEGAS